MAPDTAAPSLSPVDAARDELLAAVVFEKRRGTLPPSVHAAATTWMEAKR